MSTVTKICTIDGCDRKHNARGWCVPHYKRWRLYGDPEASAPRADPVCAIDDCERTTVGRGWCAMHYHRWQRYGDPKETHTKQRQTCVIDGCEKFRVGSGWCSLHYTRMKRYGSPTARMRGEVVDGCRVCPGCGGDKPTAEFPYATGRCKSCRASTRQVRGLYGEYVPLPEVHCLVCASRFIPRTNSNFCCSHVCSERRKRALDLYYGSIGPDPEPGRQAGHRRRAAKQGSSVKRITKEELASRMAYFGNRCWMCHGPFEAIDHVKPIARGGPHMLANLRPACNACNRAKSARWAGVSTVLSLSK